MTFDDTTNTFDEDVDGSNTRQSAGGFFTSYDEDGITYDSTSTKFDVG